MHREMRGTRTVSWLPRDRLPLVKSLGPVDSPGNPQRMHCRPQNARVSGRRGASEDVSDGR